MNTEDKLENLKTLYLSDDMKLRA